MKKALSFTLAALLTSAFHTSVLAESKPQLAQKPTPIINWESSESIGKHMEFKLDPAHGEVTYAPNYSTASKELSDNFSEIYLVRAISTKGDDQYVLYVTAQYNDKNWRSYDQAKTSKGHKMSLVPIAQNENVCPATNCRYQERIAIPLSYIHVFDSATIGMNFTMVGADSSYDIQLPSAYFKAMLDAVPEDSLYDNASKASKDAAKKAVKDAATEAKQKLTEKATSKSSI